MIKLTEDAVVKVRGIPVSNVDQYLDVMEIGRFELRGIWKNHAAETQKVMGGNFIVTLKHDVDLENFQIQVLPVLKKKRMVIYVPVVKSKKINSYFDGNLLTDKKTFVKIGAAA